MKALILKFLYIFVFSTILIAQDKEPLIQLGIPLIKYYLPKEYSAGMQNWSILQDRRGVMYIGNGSGVLEYDGVTWRLIPVPNKGARCLFMDEEGTIFVGGLNEVGYLSPDSTGNLKYVSLNKVISKEQLNIGDVWSIIIHDEKLYFQTFSTLIILEVKNSKHKSFVDRIADHPSVTHWGSEKKFNRLFLINNKVFVQVRTVGLYEILNNQLFLKFNDDDLKQDLICLMLPYNSTNKILIGLVKSGLFLLDGNKIEKYNDEADDYLVKNRLYWNGTILQDGTYAMGTQSGGIVIMGKDGKLKRIINKDSGFNSNSIWYLFADRSGILWIAQHQGIAKIIYPSSLQIQDEKSGFTGTINDINYFNGKVYLATSSGLFYGEKSPESPGQDMFYPVKGITGYARNLLHYKNSLLASTSNGVAEIKDNSASIIPGTSKFALCLYNLQNDSSIIYAGFMSGIEIFKYEGKHFRWIGKIADISSGVKTIGDDGNKILWLNCYLKKRITGLKIPEKVTDLGGYKKINAGNESSFSNEMKLFTYKQSVYFYDNKMVYTFDNTQNRFIPAELFSGLFTGQTKTIRYIYCDSQNILWCIVNNNTVNEIQEIIIENSRKTIKNYPYFQMMIDMTGSNVFAFFSCTLENKEKILWGGEGNILAKYNIASRSIFSNTSLLLPLIRRVYIYGNKIIYNGFEKNIPGNYKELHKVDYSNNLVGFEFASPDYLKENENEYQYKLEGFDKVWSSWGKETKKEYTNLSAGKYYFLVHSRNIRGEVSGEAIYGFEIILPWYMTWWAKLAALLIVLLIINYLIKMRLRYLNEKTILLERTVAERTQKIIEQKETLEEQAKTLLELNRAKSNLFANISHEFRTPLTLIKGQLENLMEIEHDEAIKKKIKVAYSNSKRLHSLINQILDLSKMDSWKVTLKLGSIDLVPVVLGRAASFELLAKEKGIELKAASNVKSLPVRIDKEKFEKVIDNLLSNAFKFTSRGGTVSVSIDKVNTEETEKAQICVSDTGIGIPKDKLPFIFGRYYQVDDSKTRQYEGTGLGLAIVKELVELQNGMVTVDSTVGKGSRFIILLPVEAEEKAEVSIPVNEESSTGIIQNETEADKELILIVEDNADVRNYIKDNLELNYRILEAADGEEGIQKAVEYIPDLIISDLMMPKVDGYGLCNRLKNDKRTSHIPIIILTALVDEKSKIEGLKTGADEYLSKPFSTKELEVRVGNLLHIRRLLREKYREVSVLRPEDIKANLIDKEFIEKVFVIINNHLEDEQFDVQKLAEEAGMSVSQINRKLSAIINVSAGKLIRNTRMDFAAKLLTAGVSIAEIANKIGFSNIPAFNNSFKVRFGTTPSEYRKNNHNS